MVRSKRMLGYHSSSFHETCIDEDIVPSPPKFDPEAVLASFKNHWAQVNAVMLSEPPTSGFNSIKVPKNQTILYNDVISVVNHIDQMVTLLLRSLNDDSKMFQRNSQSTDIEEKFNPLLDFFIQETIMEKIFLWSREVGEFSNIMKLEQLKVYEMLLCAACHTHCYKQIFCKPLISSLHKLLNTCRNTCPLEVEKRLVVLLNTLCNAISRDNNLLDLFFIRQNDSKDEFFQSNKKSSLFADSNTKLSSERKDFESRFLIFSLLISFIHREGAIGQQARNGLLQLIPLSRSDESLSHYIAYESNFPPVMATVLCALYSSLPRKLLRSDDRVQIYDEDIQRVPELHIYSTCLDSCNAVVQIAHPIIKEQMISLLYQGFLVPVIGPALHESTVQQIITTTAYLELCLRRVTNPSLLQAFLKFICLERFDGQRILNSLIARIQATTKLSLISLTLFMTMVDLNCEDVLIELVFKYVSNLNFTKSKEISTKDRPYNSSLKFLSLLPIHHLKNSFSSSQSQSNVRSLKNRNFFPCFAESYLGYLEDARSSILIAKHATQTWFYRNGTHNISTNFNSPTPTISSPVDSGISTQNSLSNYEELNNGHKLDTDVERSHTKNSSTSLLSEAEMIGPFLSNTLSRLSQLPYNDPQLNLILTGLIAKLASFRHDPLKSFLLDCDLNLHRNVRNLFTVMKHIKANLEDLTREMEDFFELYDKIRNSMVEQVLEGKSSSSDYYSNTPVTKSAPNSGKKRSSLLSLLSWGSNKVVNSSPKPQFQQSPSLESLNEGYRYINRRNTFTEGGAETDDKSYENQRVVQAVIIFEEFVKEIAALAQEHETIGGFNLFQ